ncbi:glucosyltransferase domain-containing protein [Bartonella apis]|uniref:glucosyltransferase domain-containing protein n=1 Tax=Bartonella apis TaxID=1686310 RepID=UPI0024323314|nr:glucosyltransferase domain-containing protein [Bartonella apis]
MICENTDQKKFYITATIATLLFYFPLILSNYYYRDDFERLVSQTPGWSEYGRPFADVLAFFLSADWQWMPDSSPFFLIIALCLTIVSACLCLKIRSIPFNAVTAALLVAYIFNPFLLAAYLYRFDCVIMAMGLTCSLLGWAYYKNSKIKSAIFCFISMGFYQSYINMFIILVLVETLFDIYRGRKISIAIRYFIKSVIFAALITVFFYFFDKIFIDEYAAVKGQFIFQSSKGAAHYIAVTTENVFSRYFGFLSTTGKILYGIAICVGFAQIQLHFYRDTHFDKPVLRAAICSIAFLFMLPISLGVLYGIVGDSGIPPRVMPQSIFFSVCVLFLLIQFATRLQKLENQRGALTFANTKATWGIIGFFLLFPLVFSYILNSAVRIQNDLNRYYLYRIATSLESFPPEKPIYILGGLGTSSYIKDTAERMRLIAVMIPHGSDWLLSSQLKEFGYNNIKMISNTRLAAQLVTELCNQNRLPDINTMNYRIFDLDEFLFISLGRKNMCLSDYNENTGDDPQ